jgi:uncharacterized membrane protein
MELSPSRRTRDHSIDLLRGLVMVVMVLDHVRDFSTSRDFDPTDPDKTTLALFFTRWITHFCAPVFMLLAGAGAGISSVRGKDNPQLARFLLSRGLWLVFLELTWVRFGWLFNLDYHLAVGQVIWALGWCMVVLAGLIFLPRSLLFVVCSTLVLGHNALDGLEPERFGSMAWLWKILHVGGRLEIAPGHVLVVAYPLVPWIGVMGLGFLLGRAWERISRRQLIAGGTVMIVAFLVLRIDGHYGDPHPFAARSGVRTLFALLDCEKYPPSLDYLLMTLGPAILLLGLLRGRALDGPFARTLVVFGRAPMMFYLLHIPLVHAMTFPFRLALHLPLATGPFRHGLDLPLWQVYALWLLAVAILWWPTKRWAELKATRKNAWLSYL